MASERAAMRAYVLAGDAAAAAALAPGTVLVSVTHSLLSLQVLGLRLDLSSSVAAVKRKLYTHCGSAVAHMRLELRDGGSGALLASLDDDARPP